MPKDVIFGVGAGGEDFKEKKAGDCANSATAIEENGAPAKKLRAEIVRESSFSCLRGTWRVDCDPSPKSKALILRICRLARPPDSRTARYKSSDTHGAEGRTFLS